GTHHPADAGSLGLPKCPRRSPSRGDCDAAQSPTGCTIELSEGGAASGWGTSPTLLPSWPGRHTTPSLIRQRGGQEATPGRGDPDAALQWGLDRRRAPQSRCDLTQRQSANCQEE